MNSISIQHRLPDEYLSDNPSQNFCGMPAGRMAKDFPDFSFCIEQHCALCL